MNPWGGSRYLLDHGRRLSSLRQCWRRLGGKCERVCLIGINWQDSDVDLRVSGEQFFFRSLFSKLLSLAIAHDQVNDRRSPKGTKERPVPLKTGHPVMAGGKTNSHFDGGVPAESARSGSTG
jgi:hypothetical protein